MYEFQFFSILYIPKVCNLLKWFVAINEPVYIYDANADENYYLLKNDQNTVLALYQASDITGSVPREQYEYSSYGITNILDQNGLVKTFDHDLNVNTPEVKKVKSDFSNPFGYHGMWRDEHTGLYHTHYRLYDPQHVRWLTPDPAGYRDGQNLYRFYAGPNGVDVLGLNISDYESGILSEMYSRILRELASAKSQNDIEKAVDLYGIFVDQFNSFNDDSFWDSFSEKGSNAGHWAQIINADLDFKPSNVWTKTEADYHYNQSYIYKAMTDVVKGNKVDLQLTMERFPGIESAGYEEAVIFMGGTKLFTSGGKFVFSSLVKGVTFSVALKAEAKIVFKELAKKHLMYDLKALNVLMPGLEGIGLNSSVKQISAWIKHSTFNEIKDKFGQKGVEKFVSAMSKGFVGAKGENGIKVLTGKGIEVGGKYYKYEIKVLSKGMGHYRVLGNMDDSGRIIFEVFKDLK